MWAICLYSSPLVIQHTSSEKYNTKTSFNRKSTYHKLGNRNIHSMHMHGFITLIERIIIMCQSPLPVVPDVAQKLNVDNLVYRLHSTCNFYNDITNSAKKLLVFVLLTQRWRNISARVRLAAVKLMSVIPALTVVGKSESPSDSELESETRDPFLLVYMVAALTVQLLWT